MQQKSYFYKYRGQISDKAGEAHPKFGNPA